MTVSTSYSPITVDWTSSNQAIPVTWPFFTATLVVTEISSTGVETVKTLSTHYTASGGTDANGLPATGTVTMVGAHTSGSDIRVTRVTPLTQATTYATSGAFPAKTVEAAFDRAMLIAQENAGGGAAYDGITGDVMTLNSSGVTDYWDAEGAAIKNGALGVDATDGAIMQNIFNAVAASTSIDASVAAAAASAAAAAANSTSPAFTFKWSTNTAASDPGSTYVKGNNASLGSITALYLSETAIEGAIGGFLTVAFSSSSANKALVKLINPQARTNFVVLTVTAHADSGAYRTLTCSVSSSNGSFSADQTLVVEAVPVGDAGTGAVSSFNARTGAVTLLIGDLTAIDGAGSGLDADLLDGQFSAYYTDIAARLGYTPVTNARLVSTAANSGLAGGGDLTADRSLSISASNLTAETAPATGDHVVLDDVSAAATRKMTLANMLAVINGLTEDTSPDTAADFLVSYDTSASGVKKVKPSNIAAGVWVEISDTTIGSAVANVETTWTAGTYSQVMAVMSDVSVATTFDTPVVTLRNSGGAIVTLTSVLSVLAADTYSGTATFSIGLDAATKQHYGEFVGGTSTGADEVRAAARNATAPDRVRIAFSVNNIDDGRIIVYGLKA